MVFTSVVRASSFAATMVTFSCEPASIWLRASSCSQSCGKPVLHDSSLFGAAYSAGRFAGIAAAHPEMAVIAANAMSVRMSVPRS